MTETTATVTTTIPFSIISGPNKIAIYESNALTLRENPFGTIPQDYDAAKSKADTLGWFVRTSHDMQDSLLKVQDEATRNEKARIRTLLIAHLTQDGNDTAYINAVLTHLGMDLLTRKFEVVIKFGSGWGWGQTVTRFTFETDDMDLSEESIAEIIGVGISFDQTQILADAYLSIDAAIGGTDIQKYGSVEITVDLTDEYENFNVEVTEV